jgi:hypothetical protein
MTTSQLEAWLETRPEYQATKGNPLIIDDVRSKDATRKREVRQEATRIFIPDCVNPQRRERCLADPELFLKTYMGRKKFRQPFAKVHRVLIQEINDRATYGGKKAIAAPRSRGKSTIVKGMNIFITAAELRRFIVPICATTSLARRIYMDYRKEWGHNDLLYEDFPEICHPIRELQGAPQRAGRQHIDGHLTNIVWTATDYVRLPDVPGSPYGGVKMTFAGLDAAFRGLNIDDDRPDYLIIDDPETRESAKSHDQIQDRTTIIKQDIEGLEGQDVTLAMSMIGTLQNNYCLTANFTNKEIEPAWDGERYGWIVTWPTNKGMWDDYIVKRKAAQTNGDRHGIDAVDYYLANRVEMDHGVEMIADNYKRIELEDGRQVVFSAIQEAYNKIADTSPEAFQTEYQNDPPKEAGPTGMGLTADIVASRLSGLARRQLPINTVGLTAAIDLGKYRCHWVVSAWWQGAGGVVVDYGVAEVYGNDKADTLEASEPAIYRTLLNWRDELMQKKFVDAGGVERSVNCCFVDSGNFTNASYEFCRQVKGIFHPSKGMNPYRQQKDSTNKILAGANLHASMLAAQGVWLYHLDSNYWKKWTHERILTPTFDENNMLRRGSLSLFNPEGNQRHASFSQHIVAEEWVTEFVEGKGTKDYFLVKNDNNHWLDALYMTAAGSEVVGVKLMAAADVPIEPRKVDGNKPKPSKPVQQHGRFKTRPGGWIPKRR